LSTAFPKEPVPPVIIIDLLSNITFPSLVKVLNEYI